MIDTPNLRRYIRPRFGCLTHRQFNMTLAAFLAVAHFRRRAGATPPEVFFYPHVINVGF
jgi:hypothetical protein